MASGRAPEEEAMPVVQSAGVGIHYEIMGRGPAILFHTGAGGDSRMWEQAGYLDALPSFRKILVDQRGRGRSSRPAAVEAHRMEHCVADVAAVLDHAGQDAAAFWGYSNGIFVGLAFGAAHPGRIRALVGIGTLPRSDLCDLPPIEDQQAFIAEMVAKKGVSQDVDAYMAQDGERFPDAIDENVRAGDPRMYALGRLARRSWRGPNCLYAGFPAPVLLLTGEKEADDGETERAVAAMPRARVVRIPGLGHLASFYRSDVTVPLALPFLREHLGG
jgi:pimeloyl-ACP methyl ester carboxylesterase